jgi:acetolactate synthase-1/3 small subunit
VTHTIVALVQDHPGVLHRVISLIRRRGYNIESLTVGHSETPGVSRMTLVVEAENVEQVTKQLNRLIEVLKVFDVTNDPTVERETVLVKVQAPASARAGLIALTESAGARVADVGSNTMVLEVTDLPEKVEAFIDLCRPLGIKEMIRSGRIAMTRGSGGGAGARATGTPGGAAGRAAPTGQPVDSSPRPYRAQADGDE